MESQLLPDVPTAPAPSCFKGSLQARGRGLTFAEGCLWERPFWSRVSSHGLGIGLIHFYVVLGMEPSPRHTLLSPGLGLRVYVYASGDEKVSDEVWGGTLLQESGWNCGPQGPSCS